MSEELGKIEKPRAESYQQERRLYFIPLIYSGESSPAEYLERYSEYWEQAESQMSDLESKLGKVDRIYHEFVTTGSEEGCKLLEKLNDESYQIVKVRLDKGAQLEAFEENELLKEFMDWTRCISIGLQSVKVLTQVYSSYTEVAQKRNEHIAERINVTLKADETGILIMEEGHKIQFPSDIQVFYVTPPALDRIKRWLRDRETK